MKTMKTQTTEQVIVKEMKGIRLCVKKEPMLALARTLRLVFLASLFGVAFRKIKSLKN